jgi:hypothetical protein
MTSKTNTTKTRRFRPSPALILSCVALFVALSGSALAVGLAKNSVRSAQIVDGTVRTRDVKDAAVTGTKIAPNAVGPDQIAENAVSSAKVAPDSLTAQDLAPNSVTSSEVADQSLTADDLGPNSVGSSEVQDNAVGSSELQASAVRASELGPIIAVTNSTPVANGANASVTANCPEGTTVISGGAQPANFGVELTSTLRNGNGWLAQARNNSGGASSLTAFAYCLTGGSSN